ncbi:alpha/beta hydrolase [Sphingomonas oryzagri]|uniref:Alpha/beta hydrolase n=1 Tax=Sphingomonas oryzagri TaxID=3042314 RepID=A0ABT6N5Z7_9SPHN|nr:alpha/beta hydrolase [Sphingomonas oryzagri]MDH7640518.1 alpha/beta hydrolase [Sphingomonas oryzagri]
MKLGRGRVAGALLGLIASACSPLKVFNAVMPKDSGVRLIVRDAAFGPDPRQRLDVYAPMARSATPRPIIVFFYGGSWNSGTKSGYSFVGRALASRGYIVAIPDYRLVPQVHYPTFLEDNATAVRWARSHAAEIGGDPDRLVLMGHSAGAYDAAMLALDPRWLGADRMAVKALVGLAGPYDFLPFDGPVVQQTFGGVADPVTTQPVHYVEPGDPPAFLATGDKDETVRPANSDSLGAKLRAAGVPVERRSYPAVGHAGLVTAIAKPLRGRAPVLGDLTAFVNREVGSGH